MSGKSFDLEAPQTQPSWLRPAIEALAAAPDPHAARIAATEVLEAATRELVEPRAASQPQRLADVLWALCAVAPFLVPWLRRRPAWLGSLLSEALDEPRDQSTLDAALGEALAQAGPGAESAALRRFKYYELARVTVRDCAPELVSEAQSAVTLRELTLLADALLRHALACAHAASRARLGPARWRSRDGNDVELSFVVLGLGKLGSEELNYSSDVDLIYVFQAPRTPIDHAHEGAGYAKLPPSEYFSRLAQNFGGLVTETTEEGFLYRIDLDLRPEGNLGTLVVSDEALALYHEVRADTWEHASFMKARPVAGDIEFGWQVIRTIDPMIYRSTMDYAAVEGIRALKQKIESARGKRQGAFDVKIDAGGIRDIEFIAQAMQLLHGGRIEQLRGRSTQDALEQLRAVRLLPSESVDELLSAYRFLRRLENRLQMEAERQTHSLMLTEAGVLHAARALRFAGDDASETFAAVLEEHRRHVLEVFHSFFFEGGSQRIFELFARHVPRLLATESSRALLDELAAQFAREIDNGSEPERALNNLDRFIDAVGSGRFYFELLLDRPELVPRLAAMFSTSNYLSSLLASHPTLIEPVFHDPNVLLLTRAQLERDFASILTQCRENRDDAEAALEALRLFVHRQLLNVGLLDVGGNIAREEAERSLTEIAEVCLSAALALAEDWLLGRRAEFRPIARRTRFLIVGMGKLASRELSYGSDLDLIFLFDVLPQDEVPADGGALVEAQEYATRLAQRVISTLQTNTEHGMCYEVDARLRPSGNQGTLVTSLASFERYHGGEAQIWERQILLRARHVCGAAELGAEFEALRLSILGQPLPDDARAEIHRVRQRMEAELASETDEHRDFKRGRGGLLDIESVVQLLQLEHGDSHPDLLQVLPTAQLLQTLAKRGLLEADDATALAEGWDFLQQLGNRLRILENRSISDLDVERGDLDGLARALGYTGADARRKLLSDYRSHTERTRAIYLRLLCPRAT